MPRTSRLPPAVLFGVLALAPFAMVLAPAYWVFLGTAAAINAIVIRSLGLVTGQTGMISLCQLSFAAVGAWTVGRLNLIGVPVPFPLAVLAGGLVAVPFGVLVGLPALRLRGVNLAVVTLGFAAAADTYLTTNGFPGADIAAPVIVSGPIGEPRTYFAMCWAMFLTVAVALGLAGRTRLGAAWLAVRGSERATAAMGCSVPMTKLSAFAISAGVAGIGGGLLAGQSSILTAAQFQPLASLATFAVAVMIGSRFSWGAAMGGAMVTFLPEVFRRLGLPLDLGDLLFAVGATVSLRFQGYGGAAERIQVKTRNRRLSSPAEATPHSRDAEPSAQVTGSRPAPGPPATRAALEIRGLTVRFGRVVALDTVDLVVPPRSVSALIGPNGAGKSTLVDAVTGFLRGYEGTITVAGVPLDRLSVHRRARSGVRRTFQHARTIAELTIGEYLRLVARRPVGQGELDELLAFLACPSASTPIDLVDVGTRRLVEVAGALAARPAIVLLDEPAAGLAEAESQALATRIAEIPDRFGCGVLLIEHDMAHVQAASSTVTALRSGRVVASGRPDEVLAHRDVVAAYLGPQVGAP